MAALQTLVPRPRAILALPLHFKSTTVIEGMLANDIFTLNSALAATIEEHVVATLNILRPAKDWLRFFKKHTEEE